MLAQGNAPGPGIHRLQCALKRALDPFRPFRAGDDMRAYPPGRCPGWHPPRRRRDTLAVFSSKKKLLSRQCISTISPGIALISVPRTDVRKSRR